MINFTLISVFILHFVVTMCLLLYFMNLFNFNQFPHTYIFIRIITLRELRILEYRNNSNYNKKSFKSTFHHNWSYSKGVHLNCNVFLVFSFLRGLFRLPPSVVFSHSFNLFCRGTHITIFRSAEKIMANDKMSFGRIKEIFAFRFWKTFHYAMQDISQKDLFLKSKNTFRFFFIIITNFII